MTRFEPWLDECRKLLSQTLRFDHEKAREMVEGAGLQIYRAKFDRGLTPQQCVDDELSTWNE